MLPELPLAALVAIQSASLGRPTAIAVKVDVAPVIDGRLDDAVWSLARPIREFVQVEPIEGAAPTEKTEVRILYDSSNLYLGIRCFEDDPAGIIGTQMGRDAVLDPDDRVEIVIDTFRDRRNAFWFQMNPVGSKGDALISNNGDDFNKPWDGIWEGKSSIDAGGWSVEMAIPFATLSFDPAIDTWGFNVRRQIKRRLESDRWAAPRLDLTFFQVAEAGDLAGLSGLHQGLGLDVVPFFRADWKNDRTGAEPESSLVGKPGLDAFYRLTPNLTASLTMNTDFSETEVDQRQINLTRFPLFFPEKRSFFLENAGIFQFADLGNDLIPFFSRRVGLDANGDAVPILWGGKLTGRAGDWNIGSLDVETDAYHVFDETTQTEHQVSEQNLFVARISRNVGEQSTVGGIVTNGNPAGGVGNSVYGLDYNFRTSHFQGDKNLTASVFGLRSETEGVDGGDLAYGASIAYPNDLWSAKLSWKEIQENFFPALGFVPRAGIRSWDAVVEYKPRINRAVRWLEFGQDTQVITDLDDRVETVQSSIQPLGIVWDSGDELHFFVKPDYERLDVPFEIQPGISIPAGEYDVVRYRVEAESALKRPVSGSIAFEVGDFFDGTRTDAEAEVDWRPSPHFTGALGYAQNHVDLPEGVFTTHVGLVRANVAFTPDIDWQNFVQFDNESESIGWNSRFRWIVHPGEEMFLVWNQVEAREDGALVPLFEQAAFKIGYTLRF
jgi:hypothetical protein